MNEEKIQNLIKNKPELVRLLSAYVGKDRNLRYYFEAFDAIYIKKTIPPFSLLGFIGGLCYLTYRKLYSIGFAVFAISFIAPLLFQKAILIISFMISYACGSLFYQIYFKQFFKTLENAGYGIKPLEEVEEILKEKGGVDYSAFFLFFLILSLQSLTLTPIP
ncbi:MAG: hypothetical protein BWY78_00026 [Alphaproteobacteria bacterium ADurb.Bin438]|nr:MAG: hypothetical protein BWY78_00026 [Alphaproteobacteria bacterium ADurb.Bin438]